jgi:hypothetical protein
MDPMKEERIPATELAQFLESLAGAFDDVVAAYGRGVRFIGLPVEEWAGPGYAVATLFDPEVLAAPLKPARIYLDYPETAPEPGVTIIETRRPQKEKISFAVNPGRRPVLHLPTLWGGVPYHRLRAEAGWTTLAEISEHPGLLVREGAAVFAFNPLRVLHRHLCMAQPETTRDLTDLMVMAVLGSAGSAAQPDDNDLRRDFHALGVSVLLLAQLYRVVGRRWDPGELREPLGEAARRYRGGDFAGAKSELAALFGVLQGRREALVPTPVHIMVMPHGGILFADEGYAEYDWPEAAARVLNLFLDWSERFGFRFAPDIGAGTLEEFVKLHPRTVARLRTAWDEGRIEFVNGSYSQPYIQMFPEWDQDRQFAVGLRVFDALFGRHPTVYAAQEIALHPALPTLLAKHGYRHAIHRSQNLGRAPIDTAPLIDWQSPGQGAGLRSLPAHPLRTERRGGETWRHLPVLLLSSRNQGLPFIAITSLMDQTFIDIYHEEILRAHQYAPVWGDFRTPTGFFEATRDVPAPPRCYALDDYHCELDLSGNSIHGHQTGGYSSQQAFLFQEGARLRELERAGTLAEADLKRFLNQEAHDSYIIPYFAPGYFMEGGLTDYIGPRYRCCTDGPRGVERCIRDAAGYPKTFSDPVPSAPEPCDLAGFKLTYRDVAVEIDPATAAVVRIGGQAVSFGKLLYNGAPLTGLARSPSPRPAVIALRGTLPGFGEVAIEYFVSGGWLWGQVKAVAQERRWTDTRICWADCVHLEHATPAGAQVWRTVSGVTEPTRLERFHSLDELAFRGQGRAWRFRHGGNIFFRQPPEAVQNRLWCYDEFCDTFHWGVALSDNNLQDQQPGEGEAHETSMQK